MNSVASKIAHFAAAGVGVKEELHDNASSLSDLALCETPEKETSLPLLLSKEGEVDSESSGTKSKSVLCDEMAVKLEAADGDYCSSGEEADLMDCWKSHNMAVLLTPAEWTAILSGCSTGLLRGFCPRKEELMAILPDASNGAVGVGLLLCKGHERLNNDTLTTDPAVAAACGSLYSTWQSLEHQRQKGRKISWLWKITQIYAFDTPEPIPKAGISKRWFHRPIEIQGFGEPTKALHADLHETAAFLLGRVQQPDQDAILRVGQALRGKEIRVGTTCSGCDICIDALQCVFDVISGEVAKLLQPKLALYENVKAAGERSRNKDGDWVEAAVKAWTNVDTFRYLLPQRRNRIWGFAAVASARKREEMESTYTTVLNAMASHSKIASGEIFLPAPQQSLQKGRHEEVLANALKACGSRGLFVDCSTSVRRTVAMNCGVPCVLPTHPVWSVDHQRYLGASDFLRAQGIFPGSFKKEVYETMLNTNGLAQSIGFKGYYRCCLYKWKKQRASQMWDLIAQSSPRVAQRRKEVPNGVRLAMGKALKFGTRAKANDSGATTIVPAELQELVAETVVTWLSTITTIAVVNGLLLTGNMNLFNSSGNSVISKTKAERIDLGEECDYYFVSDVLASAIDVWNSGLDKLKQKLDDPKGLCQQLALEQDEDSDGEQCEEGDEKKDVDCFEQSVENLKERLSSRLRRIELKRSE
ncbi:unnamed protein product, partial [Durusdinium trenchii]